MRWPARSFGVPQLTIQRRRPIIPLSPLAGPSGAPEFLADKISTSSTSLSVVWRPPPAATLNGEFLGYEMTYRPAAIAAAAASDNDIGGAGTGVAKKIAINEDMLRIQVSQVLHIPNVYPWKSYRLRWKSFRVSIAMQNHQP